MDKNSFFKSEILIRKKLTNAFHSYVTMFPAAKLFL